MRKRQKRWADQQKKLRKLVADQAKSGLSAREFATRKGVSYDTFIRWRRRLNDQEESEGVVEFLPVQVEPTVQAGTCYELVLRTGHVLRIPPRSFDSKDLKRLVQVLDSAC